MAHKAEDAGQTSGAETFRSMFTQSVFHGTPEKDFELFYERAAEFDGWNETCREQCLYVALEGNSRKWYTTTLWGTNAPTTWDTWKGSLKEGSGTIVCDRGTTCGSDGPSCSRWSYMSSLRRAATLHSDERKDDGGEALPADPWPEAGNDGTICPSKPAGQGRLPQYAEAFEPGKRQLVRHNMWAMPSYPLPGFNTPRRNTRAK